MFYKISIKLSVLCLLFLTVSVLGSSYPPTKFDFDGDGKADIGVFRPSNGVWYIQRSKDGFAATQFGMNGDTIVPADYDGDGKNDLAVYRIGAGVSPLNSVDNTWYILKSSDNTMYGGKWGRSGGNAHDAPVPADYDADGKTDIAVLHKQDVTTAPGDYIILQSSTNAAIIRQWGFGSDASVLADYDGDGKDDFAVFRRVSFTEAGIWYILQSSNGQVRVERFGLWNDRLVPADYDGDGKTDIAVYRPSNGTWYRINSSNGSFYAEQFGVAEDKPVPADYDGDGKTDIAVFRPSDGTWYIYGSLAGLRTFKFGAPTDIPIPNAYVR